MGEEENKEIFRSALSHGENALKSVIIINGGASVALLAFIGNLVAKGTGYGLVRAFSLPLACYVFGVLVGSLATGTSYVTNYSYFHYSQKIGRVWHLISAGLVVVAYTLFAIGSFISYEIFRKLV